MGISLDYQGDVHTGDCTYAVRARFGDAGHVEIELTGTDIDGDAIADGQFVLPAHGLAACGQLLSEVMEALSRLHDPRRSRKRGTRAASATNANAPWTTELDTELKEHWLTGGAAPTAGTTVIGELAERFGRSRSSIRARLARVGCDPDVPGRELSSVDGPAEAAEAGRTTGGDSTLSNPSPGMHPAGVTGAVGARPAIGMGASLGSRSPGSRVGLDDGGMAHAVASSADG